MIHRTRGLMKFQSDAIRSSRRVAPLFAARYKNEGRAVIKQFYLKQLTTAQIKLELEEVTGTLDQR